MENKGYPTKATIFNRVFPGCHWAVKTLIDRTCIELENKQTKTSSVLSKFLINISFYFHSSTYYLILLLQQFSPHKKLN